MSAENTADKKERRRRRRHQAAQESEEEDSQLEVEEVEEEEDDDDSRSITAGKGRATPGRRNTQEVVKTGNAVTRFFGSLREYFEGVNSEVRKVAWPTREETRRLTSIVILVTIAASIILGLIGLGFTELFRLGLANPVVFVVFFAIVGALAFMLYRRIANSSDVSPY
jgi:preprotein translocase subunit SecE